MSLCRVIVYDTSDRTTFHEYARARIALSRRGLDRSFAESKAVAKIIEDVRINGLWAVWKYTRRFDAPKLRIRDLVVTEKEIKNAVVSKEHHAAIVHSIERVREFHEAQLKALTKGWQKSGEHIYEWRMPARHGANDTGYEGQRLVPIEKIGVYAPGGKASYPSSVIMNAVPALAVGAKEIRIATPPLADGSLHPAILIAARELGISQIIKSGGAAAVAILAHGDNSAYTERGVPKNTGDLWHAVDKIVGPGNKWVNEAKRQLWGLVGFDTYAGPSEVAVVADETANPAWAAADWLSQVEHAEDNFGVLVTWSKDVANAILAEAEKQLKGSPREQVMRTALKDHGIVIIDESRQMALNTASSLAAEHLTLMVENPEEALQSIEHSGCILLGSYTPQSAGDFCSGPSHTLPTSMAARFGSPLNVMEFLRFQSISRLTREDLKELLPTIEAFGEMEGFPQHARGASIRFEE
ncbi:MAG: histidinol dehydrogenase [Fimbriimonadaceae bacterium]|nr:histidinol dehydrogenase [Fimbriimonadaceae bacterium]